MRPLDVVVLMKLLSFKNQHQSWLNKDIAKSLSISASEVSESLNRSAVARLVDDTKQKVRSRNTAEFLQHGLKYVFPQQPGALQRGMPTAHSAPMFGDQFIASEKLVWPDADGIAFGHGIEPLYSTVPQSCRDDKMLWELLALVEMLRVGKTREVKFATERLSQFL
jgi:hypothetical protein